MTSHAGLLHATMDFSCPYQDIVRSRGWWVMEEWLHWVETWSLVILQPYKTDKGAVVETVHDEDVRMAWKALKHMIMHFMRADPAHATQEACATVADAVTLYSKHVKAVFGLRACTYNLHMIVCRLHFLFDAT